MEEKLIYISELFRNPQNGKCPCNQVSIDREQFSLLCSKLGNSFFDYISEVRVYQDKDAATIVISKQALEQLKQI